jgi:hypothetical protein
MEQNETASRLPKRRKGLIENSTGKAGKEYKEDRN